MAESVLALLVFFVYVLTVALSGPLALAVVFVARRRSVTAALGTVVGTLAGLVTLGGTVVAALVSPLAGVVTFASGLAALLGLVVVPLLVGRSILRRVTGLDRENALRYAVTGWPLALAASFGLYVAPGGVARYNITFLDGPLALLAWAAWLAVVLFGPGVVGIGLVRLFDRFR